MHYNTRENNGNWNGGKTVFNGYVFLLNPDHPNAIHTGYVREHRLVGEKVLGKILPRNAQIHHVNGKKDDNRNENLVICENSEYHKFLHKRKRSFEACGHADWVICHYCRQYGNPLRMTTFYKKRSLFIHKHCNIKRMREYKEKKRASSTPRIS